MHPIPPNRFARGPNTPPRTKQNIVVRAAAVGTGGNSVVQADDWTTIDRATPDTNTGVQPARLKAGSDTDSNYDGTTAATKMIVHFASPISYSGSGDAPFLLLGTHYSSSASIVLADISAAFNVTNAAATNTTRFRLVTAAFTCSTTTWNNYSSLTMVDSTTTLQYSCSSIATDITRVTHDRPTNALFGVELNYGSAYTAYGVVIDCRPTHLLTGDLGAAASSISSALEIVVASPFAVPIIVVP